MGEEIIDSGSHHQHLCETCFELESIWWNCVHLNVFIHSKLCEVSPKSCDSVAFCLGCSNIAWKRCSCEWNNWELRTVVVDSLHFFFFNLCKVLAWPSCIKSCDCVKLLSKYLSQQNRLIQLLWDVWWFWSRSLNLLIGNC